MPEPGVPFWTGHDQVPPAGPATDRLRRTYLWAFWLAGPVSSLLLALLDSESPGVPPTLTLIVTLGLMAWVLVAQWRLMMTLGNSRIWAIVYSLGLFIPIVFWFVLSSVGGACDRAWGRIGAWAKPPTPPQAAPEEPTEYER